MYVEPSGSFYGKKIVVLTNRRVFSAANMFFYQNGQWFTPELKRAGVDGVMRQHLMQQMPVTEVNWQIDELRAVDAMFICNALMGIVPVRRFEHNSLSLAPVQQFIQQVVC